MPILEFLCRNGHTTDKLIRSRTEADSVESIYCPVCKFKATRIVSSGSFFMHGAPGGYSKPSPCAKRVVDVDSISYQGKGYVNTNQSSY